MDKIGKPHLVYQSDFGHWFCYVSGIRIAVAETPQEALRIAWSSMLPVWANKVRHG